MSSFTTAVQGELNLARHNHGPIHSAHEGYAVLLEEVEEVWEEVRKPRRERSKERMFDELVQVAAVAQRMAEDICNEGRE